MFGKLIAYGEDRASAIRRARAALDGYVVEGIPTNRPLLAWILDHPTFRDGQATTGFLGEARHRLDPEPAITGSPGCRRRLRPGRSRVR